MDDIINNPELPWIVYWVSLNPNITIDFVLKNLHLDWDWRFLSKNKGITMDDINNNPTLPWDFGWVSRNPNITIDFVLQNKHRDKTWNWKELSGNLGITNEDITNIPDLPFDWGIVSRRKPCISVEFIAKNLDKNWDWAYLTANSCIDDIENYPKLPWALYQFAIFDDYPTQHINKNQDFYSLSHGTFGIDVKKLVDYNRLCDYCKKLSTLLNKKVTNKYLIMDILEDSTKLECYKIMTIL